MAAGDLREERNEKTEKKTGSPQGWEEGKNEGITFPRGRGPFIFQHTSPAFHSLLMLNFIKDAFFMSLIFSSGKLLGLGLNGH